MINNVAVVGLGAVGALYARKLTDYLGSDHCFAIATGARAQKLQEGLLINNCLFKPTVRDFQSCPEADLILIATKNLDLEEVIDQGLGNLVGENTSILSLLNGIESESILSEKYGKSHILPAFAMGLSSEHVGKRIDFTSDGKIVFGEFDNTPSPRVKEIKALFDNSKIGCEVPDDILHQLWRKFALNTAFNTLSAICRATYGVFSTSACLQELVDAVFYEVQAVGDTQGVKLSQEDLRDIKATIASLDKMGKTSMFQDIQGHRHTESPWFTGTIHKLGQRYGIPTPVSSLLFKVSMASEDAALFTP